MATSKRKKLAGQLRHVATTLGGMVAAYAASQADLSAGTLAGIEDIAVEIIAAVLLAGGGMVASWLSPEKRDAE